MRKQLLGKRAYTSGIHAARQQGASGLSHQASKPRPRNAPTARRELSDDDEGGRSGLGKKSKAVLSSPKEKSNRRGDEDAGVNSTEVAASTAGQTSASKKHKGSYLDQVLAERAAKKRKKQNRPD